MWEEREKPWCLQTMPFLVIPRSLLRGGFIICVVVTSPADGHRSNKSQLATLYRLSLLTCSIKKPFPHPTSIRV